MGCAPAATRPQALLCLYARSSKIWSTDRRRPGADVDRISCPCRSERSAEYSFVPGSVQTVTVRAARFTSHASCMPARTYRGSFASRSSCNDESATSTTRRISRPSRCRVARRRQFVNGHACGTRLGRTGAVLLRQARHATALPAPPRVQRRGDVAAAGRLLRFGAATKRSRNPRSMRPKCSPARGRELKRMVEQEVTLVRSAALPLVVVPYYFAGQSLTAGVRRPPLPVSVEPALPETPGRGRTRACIC